MVCCGEFPRHTLTLINVRKQCCGCRACSLWRAATPAAARARGASTEVRASTCPRSHSNTSHRGCSMRQVHSARQMQQIHCAYLLSRPGLRRVHRGGLGRSAVVGVRFVRRPAIGPSNYHRDESGGNGHTRRVESYRHDGTLTNRAAHR